MPNRTVAKLIEQRRKAGIYNYIASVTHFLLTQSPTSFATNVHSKETLHQAGKDAYRRLLKIVQLIVCSKSLTALPHTIVSDVSIQ